MELVLVVGAEGEPLTALTFHRCPGRAAGPRCPCVQLLVPVSSCSVHPRELLLGVLAAPSVPHPEPSARTLRRKNTA